MEAHVEQEGVAALTASLAALTKAIGERDEELQQLKDENARTKAENNRLRSKLNAEYANSSETFWALRQHRKHRLCVCWRSGWPL